MRKNKIQYKIALIIPTKDRPEKIKTLLDSLASQSRSCDKIIIVDGGDSIKHVVMGYQNKLNIEYCRCRPPGQIRQRNLGISKVDESFDLIGFIDDDMIFHRDAFEKMINFWNNINGQAAGIGFNIVNAPVHTFSRLLALIFMSSPVQGKVLKSGFNTSIQNINRDISSQWLGGGYTIWKRSIIKAFPQKNLNTKWATGEDLRYSYPIGKKHPLYVCASAKVRHEHTYTKTDKKMGQYFGRKGSLGFFYFNSMHQELSSLACLWMLAWISIISFFYGLFTFSSRKVKNALGQAEAFIICLKSIAAKKDIVSELED